MVELSEPLSTLWGFGIGIFEIRTRFKTASAGVIASHADASFSPGSWRLQIATIAGVAGRLAFYFADFSATQPLMYTSASFADNVEHDVRVAQLSNGQSWHITVDGTEVGNSGWINRVAGAVNAPIFVGNDPNVAGGGFVGTIGEVDINIFLGR